MYVTYFMTQLYSADLTALSKPVKRKRKEEKPATPPPTEPSEKEASPSIGEPEPEPTVQTQVTPDEPVAKKPKSEKQLAALERAREKRRVAKEEKERLAREEEQRQAALEAAREAKKEAQREKRRAAREAKLLEQGIEPTPQKGQVVKVNRSRPVYKEESEPPAWFKKYVEGVKKEKSKMTDDRKPQKEIREEAQQEAQVRWDDESTRHRVNHEVDNHMNRMYSMIFGKR